MAKGNKSKRIIKNLKTVSINNLSHFYGKNENKKQVLNDVKVLTKNQFIEFEKN